MIVCVLIITSFFYSLTSYAKKEVDRNRLSQVLNDKQRVASITKSVEVNMEQKSVLLLIASSKIGDQIEGAFIRANFNVIRTDDSNQMIS